MDSTLQRSIGGMAVVVVGAGLGLAAMSEYGASPTLNIILLAVLAALIGFGGVRTD